MFVDCLLSSLRRLMRLMRGPFTGERRSYREKRAAAAAPGDRPARPGPPPMPTNQQAPIAHRHAIPPRPFACHSARRRRACVRALASLTWRLICSPPCDPASSRSPSSLESSRSRLSLDWPSPSDCNGARNQLSVSCITLRTDAPSRQIRREIARQRADNKGEGVVSTGLLAITGKCVHTHVG